jgi:hypothetical protein
MSQNAKARGHRHGFCRKEERKMKKIGSKFIYWTDFL